MQFNLRMFCARILFVIVALYASTSATAQLADSCGCNAGLVREALRYSEDSSVRLAYLAQIDEKQYETLKKQGSADTSLLDLISGSASYSEFNQRRSEYLAKFSYSLSIDQSRSIVYEQIKTADWLACKRVCISQQRGFICELGELTTTVAAVSCSWRPEGVSQRRMVSVTANAKSVQGKMIDPNTTRDWQIKRDRSTDLLLTFTPDGGSSQTIKIPPSSKVATFKRKSLEIASCIGRGGVEGVHFWGPRDATCNAVTAWGAYSSSPQSPARVCRCTGHGGVEGVGLWGPEGETCAGIPAWGKYTADCKPLASTQTCACIGGGDKIGNHVLWGPKGATCANIPSWGTYSQFCTGP
jgi:hypothetical protein